MNKMVKLALAPRHSVLRYQVNELHNTRPSLDIHEAFQNLVTDVIPNMQLSVEWRMIMSLANSMPTELEKQEVIDAYMQRKYNYGEHIRENKSERADTNGSLANSADIIYSINGKGLKYMGCEDIGKYVVFPVKEYKKVFPVEPFGSYIKDELIKTKIYSVKCREEALRITHFLSHKKFQSQRTDPLETFRNKDINDSETFAVLYQNIADIVRKVFKEQSAANSIILHMFNTASIFDSIITLLINFLRVNQNQDYSLTSLFFHPQTIEAFANQFISLLAEVCKNKKINKPFNINEILEFIDEIHFQLPSALITNPNLPKSICFTLRDYQLLSKYLWRPKAMEDDSFHHYKGFNTGALLHGESGAGKSQIMSFVSLWAHEMGWFVIPIKGSNFTSNPRTMVEYHYSGLHFDVKSSLDLLKAIHAANYDYLNAFDVDMSIYGKCDLAGTIAGDPEFNTRVYNKKRKYWSDDWKLHFPNEKLKEFWDIKANAQKKVLEKMPKEPKKWIDIVTPALKEPILCTAAVGEILRQLKQTKGCNSLIAVDDYNEWYLNTQFKSFRYENSKETKYGVPGYDFAIPRMFMRLDSHKYENCFKIFATSNYRLCHHICTPDKINFPEGYDIKINNMPLDDFRLSLKYFNLLGYGRKFNEVDVEKYYMESQGNIRDFHRSYFDTQSEHFAEA